MVVGKGIKKKFFSFFFFFCCCVRFFFSHSHGLGRSPCVSLECAAQPHDKNVVAWHVFILCCRISRTRWVLRGHKTRKQQKRIHSSSNFRTQSRVLSPYYFIFFFPARFSRKKKTNNPNLTRISPLGKNTHRVPVQRSAVGVQQRIRPTKTRYRIFLGRDWNESARREYK